MPFQLYSVLHVECCALEMFHWTEVVPFSTDSTNVLRRWWLQLYVMFIALRDTLYVLWMRAWKRLETRCPYDVRMTMSVRQAVLPQPCEMPHDT